MFHAQFNKMIANTVPVIFLFQSCANMLATNLLLATLSYRYKNGNIAKNIITIHDNGLIYSALKTSPCNNIFAARRPPQPGHGKPVSSLNGHNGKGNLS